MFNRPVTEGHAAGVAGSGPSRADLAASAPSGSVELPAQAVTETAANHETPQDHHRLMHDAGLIGRVRAAVDDVYAVRKQRAELEALQAKLMFNGKSASGDQTWSEEVERKSLDALERFRALEEAISWGGEDKQVVDLSASANQNSGRIELMGKIEAALEKVGALREKLTKREDSAHERLIGLNLSVSSLNTARVLARETPFGLSAASSAVDHVLANVRAMVAAHGKISPDLVRLVINL